MKKMIRSTTSILLVSIISGCIASQPTSADRRTLPNRAQHTPNRLVRFKERDKIGFRTEAGDVIIPAKYDNAGDFAFGLARVNIGAQWQFPGFKFGGKWGYVNEHGRVVVSISLDYAKEFSDGLAQVQRGKTKRYIDTSGETVFTVPHTYRWCGDFSEGLIPLQRSTEDGTWQITDYVNKQGKIVLTVGAAGEEFHEGVAVASVRNPKVQPGRHMSHLSGGIDRTGRWIIPPVYAEVREFSEGLAAVRPKKTTIYGMGDKWGYVNKNGEFVIPLHYNEAHSFFRGVALVHTGGELQVAYDAPSYWQGGEWMFINRQGEVLKRSSEWMDIEEYANQTMEGTK